MYEPIENCGVKSLFAVRFIVGHYTGNGYIAWVVSVMTLITEICGEYILCLFEIIIPFEIFVVIIGVIKIWDFFRIIKIYSSRRNNNNMERKIQGV